MPRQARSAPGGLVYHVINRGNGRRRLFGKQADYLAFEKVMLEAMAHTPTRLLGWCLMPNHWHLVLWPRKDGSRKRDRSNYEIGPVPFSGPSRFPDAFSGCVPFPECPVFRSSFFTAKREGREE
jgi:hypothetical protein